MRRVNHLSRRSFSRGGSAACLGSLRSFLKRRKRLVEFNPRQFVFEEDRFLRRKRCRIVQRRNREIDRVRIFRIFEKQMSSATCGKRTNPIRVRNFARLAFSDDKVFARHRSPLHVRRTGASPAIDAVTIHQCQRRTLQHVSCPAANASTSDFHKISLAHFNHESTRMNTNSDILGSTGCQPVGFGCQPKRTSPQRFRHRFSQTPS